MAAAGLACSNRSMGGLGAVGPGPAGANLSRVLGSEAPAVSAPPFKAAEAGATLGDSVSALANELSGADIVKLIDLIAGPVPPQDTAQLQDLLQTVFSAGAEGDVPRALEALGRIVALDPSQGNFVRTNPAIAPIQASVDQFLDRHTALARIDAEGRLEQAASQLGTSAPDRLTGWDMKPDTMVLIANRIFDSGGLANYMRAAELAQTVVDGSRWAPALVNLPTAISELTPGKSRYGDKPIAGTAQETQPRKRGGMSALLRSLWLRAPLLILLVSWLILGIAGGCWSVLWRRFWLETWPGSLVEIAFQVWGTGFLALVALGFYAHVRKVRF